MQGILPLNVCRKMPNSAEEEIWKLEELDRTLIIN